jgi:tetraprenyl-beta-curcumene synthase
VRCARELASLAYVMSRFWLSVLPLARAQLREWERIAAAIPDPALRAHALGTLRSESFSALGAALVATTSSRTEPALVRLLVALQVAWDYIDTLAEQPVADPIGNGTQLHRALVDALSAAPPREDYYRLHSSQDDGGYLAALVRGCREACATLPAYEEVREAAVRELGKAEIQYTNHAPEPVRLPALRAWTETQVEEPGESDWIELAAAASSSLGVLALLATAADPSTTRTSVGRVRDAYIPWVDALTALLDSLVDRPQDEADGMLNWVSHYPTAALARIRLFEIAVRAMAGVRELPHGGRHVVIVAGMIAMHLSQASAWLPQSEATTRAVLRATDTSVMPLLLLLMRTWRRTRVERERRRWGAAAVVSAGCSV